jgi:DNA-binding NarL/FixJ family response regulator
MHATEQIRVVVVDEHALVRAGLRALLSTAAEVSVVAVVSDLPAAIALVRQTQAQVLVVDRPVGGVEGAAVATVIAQAGLRTNLLVLTMLNTPESLDGLLHAGARGYLTRAAAERDLIEAVRTVATGQTYRCPLAVVTRGVDDEAVHPREVERRRFARLTDREREVLVCTARGFTAPEIGTRLQISAKTVDTYKLRIHEKLGLHHRSDYVKLALKLGLLEEES